MFKKKFVKLERPFLIQYCIEGNQDDYGWYWFKAEDDLKSFIKEMKKECGDKFCVKDAYEIGSAKKLSLD